MATFNGDNYTKAIDPSSANILSPGVYGGRVRVCHDEYTLVSKASGSVINMGKLPKGARVLAVLVQHGTGSTAFTLAVGNAGSGQGAIFGAATASVTTTTAPRIHVLPATPFYTVGTLTGDDIITLTTGGATSAASQKLVVDTLYTLD